MANNVVAALIEKIDQVFGGLGDDKKLFFLLPGLPISERDLQINFFAKGQKSSTQDALNAAGDFARLVNQIPDPTIERWSSDGALLWNLYDTLLTQAVLASNKPTAKEQKALKKARDVLYVQQEIIDQVDNSQRTITQDSPKLKSYKECQDAYIRARSEYNARKISAETSNSTAAKDQWDTDKTSLEANIQAAQAKWATLGFKREVEEAFASIDQITGKSPQLVWENWKAAFRQAKFTDLRGSDFYLSYFSPQGFFESEQGDYWTRIEMDDGEIKQLASTGRYSGYASELPVSRLSVDIIRVEVVRPWFDPRVFRSRTWTYPSDALLLGADLPPSPAEPYSDGQADASLPCYVTEVLIARNLQISLEGDSESAPAAGNHVALGPFDLKESVKGGVNSMQVKGMQIIGFICRALPKFPDPDRKLSFPFPEDAARSMILEALRKYWRESNYDTKTLLRELDDNYKEFRIWELVDESALLDIINVFLQETTKLQTELAAKRKKMKALLGQVYAASGSQPEDNQSESAATPAPGSIWQQDKPEDASEYARHGLPLGQYQRVFDEAARSGFRPEWIDGYTVSGNVHFNVIFRNNRPASGWWSHHNIPGDFYQQRLNELAAQGFALTHVNSYAVNDAVRYAAIWRKSTEPVTAYHGKSGREHQESFNALTRDGWRPKIISVASVSGTLQFTALYTKEDRGSWEAASHLTISEYQSRFDANAANGRHLIYLSSYVHQSQLRLTAIWAQKPALSGLVANHELTASAYQRIRKDAVNRGFRTAAITGHENVAAGEVRFAAYWIK